MPLSADNSFLITPALICMLKQTNAALPAYVLAACKRNNLYLSDGWFFVSLLLNGLLDKEHKLPDPRTYLESNYGILIYFT
jgi:hypothetical protein